MFRGFSDETFEFLMAIGFNNNREFFYANHDWYMRAVRQPCLDMAEALGDFMHENFSEEIDVRPNRVVSRINRDLRFSNDKSPYRDHMWLTFRKPSIEHSIWPEAYVGIDTNGISCGMGIYSENRPLMNGLRHRLRKDADEFRRALPTDPAVKPDINAFKRLNVPEGIPEDMVQWYRARSFYFACDISDFAVIKSEALVDTVKNIYLKLVPMYNYIYSIIPEDDTIEIK